METQSTSFSWEFCSHQEDGMEDLKHALLYTTIELETTIMSAKEEILRRECEIMNLKDLLNRAIKEKDEVEAKCGNLMLENLVLLQQHKNLESEVTPQSDSDSSKFFSCSDSDDNTIQSSQTDPIVREPLVASQELPPNVWKNVCENEKSLLSKECPPTVWENVCESGKPLLSKECPPTVWENACENEKPLLSQEFPQTVHKNACGCEKEKPLLSQDLPPTVWKNACEKPLPQKGKLLQAVIEAGPLLQNLLLAGPLPHWQHPPPLIDSVNIPPVIISPRPSQPQSTSIDIRKRSHSYFSADVSQHSHNNKHQKVVQ